MLSTDAFTNIFTSKKSSSLSGEHSTFADIDRSMRFLGLFFATSAILWLLAGSAFALIASISLHSPDFFPNWEWLTFGRVRSAHLNAMAFGWSNNAVFLMGTWVMLRLAQNKLHNAWLPLTAGIVWNLTLTAGVIAILSGQITSVEWLEMPRYLSPLLALSYLLIGIWGILAFRYRRSSHVYVSQWYILGAFFWFPWIYTAVQTVIFWFPARGVIQAVGNWWFAHNALGLWYTPVSVATAYYLIPKVLGRPIHSYYLSLVGFWSLALFYNWAGMHHLIGGPIPAWVLSAGVVASVMMVIPVVVTAINHHFTVVGSFKKVWDSPTLRFIVFGAMMYTLSSLAGSAMALREVSEVTHFTHAVVAHAHHGAYAFVAMIMFGGFYYMLPRLFNREWPSAALIRMHWWCSALGISIYVVGLTIGGYIQGLEMNNASIPFMDVVKNTVPWLMSRSFAGILLSLAHITFFIHFIWFLFTKKCYGGKATLLSDNESS